MEYEAIMNSPWEMLEWLYARHLQHLVDIQKQQNEEHNLNKFI